MDKIKEYEQDFYTFTIEEITEKLTNFQDGEKRKEYALFVCSTALELMTPNIISYNDEIIKSEMAELFIFAEKFLSGEDFWTDDNWKYTVLSNIFQENYDEAEKYLKEVVFPGYEECYKENLITEKEWAQLWFDTFKSAYDGFWLLLGEYFSSINNDDGAILSTFANNLYNTIKSQENLLELVLSFKQKYPNYIFVDEILAGVYEEEGLWHNAIRYYEYVMEKSVFLYDDYTFFSLAWCYAKIKDYEMEEYYYRKCADINSQYLYVQNNIAYSLMRQKRYAEAEMILTEVVKNELDLPESVNNLAETYIRQGKYEEADKLINSGEYKIFKCIRKMFEKYSQSSEDKDILAVNKDDDSNELLLSKSPKRKNLSKSNIDMEQFATEKILEDQITYRLETGKNVFGMALKIYNHQGDFYGIRNC